MIIKAINVEKFRAMEDVNLSIGKRLTAIVGRNASMKTTLLGLLSQPFSLGKECGMAGEKTLDGYNYRSQMSEKFKLSIEHDIPGEHTWTLVFRNKKIYNDKDYIKIKSSARKAKGKADSIRFINAEQGKTKGNGYVQIPVVYLSLTRLFPIGESGKTTEIGLDLTEKEKEDYVKWYRNILSIQSINNPEVMLEKKDAKRVFSGVSDDTHGIEASSAGEGNVGRILISILSFARLKEKYGKNYQGGILLIDEIDATLHGYSQRKIIEFLSKKSEELKLQIIFTTHSPSILRSVNTLQREELRKKGISDVSKCDFDNQIIHLKPEYNNDGKRYIIGENIVTANQLKAALNDMELKSTYLNQHIHLYTEDARSISLLRRIFKYKNVNIDQYVDHINVNLGWTNYCQLINKEIPEFLNSVIVLDKDVSEKQQNTEQKKAIEKLNVVYMPVDVEKGLFLFLKDYKSFNGFCLLLKEQGCEYSYDICFSEWVDEEYTTEEYKAWFNNLEKSIPSIDLLFDYWCSENEGVIEEFIASFVDGYNKIVSEIEQDYMIIE